MNVRRINVILVTVVSLFSSVLAARGAGTWEASQMQPRPDGKLNLLWRHRGTNGYYDGQVSLWTLDSNCVYQTSQTIGPIGGWDPWSLETSQYDGSAHLMWGSTNNAIAIWNFTPGGAFASAQAFGPYPDWFTEGLSISGYDNQQYLFWRKSDGTNVVASLWRLNSSSVFQSAQTLGPYGTRPYDYWEPQWPAISPADGRVWLLWNHFNMWSTNGNEYSLWRFNNMSSFEGATYIPPVGNDWQSTWVTCGRDGKVRLPWVQPVSYPYIGVSVWRLSGTGGFEGARMFGPVPGWIYNGLAPRPDWNQWIVWMSPAYDAISLWQLNNTEGFQSACSYGPYSGWTLNGGGVGGANRTYLLWVHTSRAVSVWRLGPTGTYECSRNYGPY